MLIEALVIVGAIAIVGGVVARYIYKKTKHMPTGECACCAQKNKKMVSEYHKKYKR